MYAGSTTRGSCARPRRRPTSCSGTAATTTCRSTSPTCTSCSSTRCGPATRRHTTRARPTCGWRTSSSSPSATPRRLEDVAAVEASVRRLNPRAEVLRCDSPVTLDDPAAVAGRRVVVVEDGPTLTHGSMSFGAGVVGARAAGAAEIVDPAPMPWGRSPRRSRKYPNARGVLPAMGYGEEQTRDLEATIRAMVEAGVVDVVVSGTPVDLTRVLAVDVPLVRARYELREQEPGRLATALPVADRGPSPPGSPGLGCAASGGTPTRRPPSVGGPDPPQSVGRRAGRRTAPARGRPRARPRATPGGRRARRAACASSGTRRSSPAG